MGAAEVTPWSGVSINAACPDAGVRTLPFGQNGEGLLTYLILEEQRRVDILDVLWIGRTSGPGEGARAARSGERQRAPYYPG